MIIFAGIFSDVAGVKRAIRLLEKIDTAEELKFGVILPWELWISTAFGEQVEQTAVNVPHSPMDTLTQLMMNATYISVESPPNLLSAGWLKQRGQFESLNDYFESLNLLMPDLMIEELEHDNILLAIAQTTDEPIDTIVKVIKNLPLQTVQLMAGTVAVDANSLAQQLELLFT